MSLQKELTASLGVAPSIRWGLPGELEVVVDGAIVFSKKVAKRMPQPGEVARLAKAVRR